MRSAYAVRRPVVNAFLVRERDRRRLRDLAWLVMSVAPLLCAMAVYTWLHLEQVRVGYRVDGLERQLRRLEQGERQLRLEAAYLASPGRIGERAATELGMAPPTLEQTLFAEELR